MMKILWKDQEFATKKPVEITTLDLERLSRNICRALDMPELRALCLRENVSILSKDAGKAAETWSEQDCLYFVMTLLPLEMCADWSTAIAAFASASGRLSGRLSGVKRRETHASSDDTEDDRDDVDE